MSQIALSRAFHSASLSVGLAALVIASVDGPGGMSAVAAEEAVAVTFEQHIRPILRAHCFDCHGATDDFSGGLDLRLKRFMVRGGESGAAIVPGDAAASHLLKRVKAGEMPPGSGTLTQEEIQLLTRWIDAGAPTRRPEPETLESGLGITPEEREFWAFQPLPELGDPLAALPVEMRDQLHTPIDALLFARLRERDLGFSEPAPRRVLIQRLAFDLTGLPPTPEQVTQFENDQSPGAYEALVDRLLASPHYGERWARHWLDVAGYADSEGYDNSDVVRPDSYRYRDYVIDALNANKPFDQFLREQLAGDELAGAKEGEWTEEQIKLLTATGFLRMAADGTGGSVNQDEARNQTIAETLKILGSGVLGLSVGCAQCHDHRYDPISHRDYHRLRAVFEPALNWKSWKAPAARRVSLMTAAQRQEAQQLEEEAQAIAQEKAADQEKYLNEALEKELTKYESPLREQLREAYQAKPRQPEHVALLKKHPSVNITPGVLYQYNQAAADALKKFDQRISEVRARKPKEEFVRALQEPLGQEPPQTFRFHRGDYRQPQETVLPGALTITAAEGERREIPPNDPNLPSTGRRLALAKWLTSGSHPLVGRVLVNRIWFHYFGRGIVGTLGDFGQLGDRPTHPELLDYLARDLAEHGWDLKRFHKQIVMSRAYRQASHRTGEAHQRAAAADPDNQLYWRMPVRRLDAEAIRDRVLATSGTLDLGKMHGPAVSVKLDDAGQVIVDDDSRRSVYLQARRSQPVALLTAFDAPVMESNCVRRGSSTVAPQALMLMNSGFVLRQAEQFAARVLEEAPRQPLDPWSGPEVSTPTSPWAYGFGRLEAESSEVVDFQPLPHWTGSAWQGGPELPHPETGWVLLTAQGGHPGGKFAAVRRWTAPADGTVTLTGKLSHGSENGDGVRGTIVLHRRRDNSRHALGQWDVKHGGADTNPTPLEISAGDQLDLIVEAREHETSDSFAWPIDVKLSAGGAPPRSWSSVDGFTGPQVDLRRQVLRAWQLAYGRFPTDREQQLVSEYLTAQLAELQRRGKPQATAQAMANLCQTLLGSNEFLYVE